MLSILFLLLQKGAGLLASHIDVFTALAVLGPLLLSRIIFSGAFPGSETDH